MIVANQMKESFVPPLTLVVRPWCPVESHSMFVPQFGWETWRYPLQVDSNLTVGGLNMSERPRNVCQAEIINEPFRANTIEFVNEASSPKQFRSIFPVNFSYCGILSTFQVVGFCPVGFCPVGFCPDTQYNSKRQMLRYRVHCATKVFDARTLHNKSFNAAILAERVIKATPCDWLLATTNVELARTLHNKKF